MAIEPTHDMWKLFFGDMLNTNRTHHLEIALKTFRGSPECTVVHGEAPPQ